MAEFYHKEKEAGGAVVPPVSVIVCKELLMKLLNKCSDAPTQSVPDKAEHLLLFFFPCLFSSAIDFSTDMPGFLYRNEIL